MQIKKGVALGQLQPVMIIAAMIIKDILATFNHELIITCGEEGKHASPKSLHHKGLAFDFRRYFSPIDKEILEAARENLSNDFDLILEVDHFHVEYDPKFYYRRIDYV